MILLVTPQCKGHAIPVILECDHVAHKNPAFTYKVGALSYCHTCTVTRERLNKIDEANGIIPIYEEIR